MMMGERDAYLGGHHEAVFAAMAGHIPFYLGESDPYLYGASHIRVCSHGRSDTLKSEINGWKMLKHSRVGKATRILAGHHGFVFASMTGRIPLYPVQSRIYEVYTDGRPKISRHGRKATVNDFYAVILPSVELDNGRKEKSSELAISSQMNLPNCCHAHETARESDFGREVLAFDIRFVAAETLDRQKNLLTNGTEKSKRAVKMMCNTYAPPMRMRTFSGLRGSNALDNIMRTGTDFHSKVAIATSVRRKRILLGLIGEGTGNAAKVLKSMGINLKDARVEVEKIIGWDREKEEEVTQGGKANFEQVEHRLSGYKQLCDLVDQGTVVNVAAAASHLVASVEACSADGLKSEKRFE
ncbi:ATP-dependent Clp protease ATP-binding subunit ClpA homolog CD4B, chloroplastic [Tanacetum coccineum]|uniref:ATP-dependent Clp protease ATP-binding subunit ClpA homolog CD4B, chloroplastic n=1 Tax=Tanacetum coccineum TaxID=301880 RepID=A0ABQ4Y9L4_9ASTR